MAQVTPAPQGGSRADSPLLPTTAAGNSRGDACAWCVRNITALMDFDLQLYLGGTLTQGQLVQRVDQARLQLRRVSQGGHHNSHHLAGDARNS